MCVCVCVCVEAGGSAVTPVTGRVGRLPAEREREAMAR